MADVRREIGKALTGFMTQAQVRKLIDEVLQSQKMVYGDFVCKGCGKPQRQPVQISDTKAVVAGIETLANQAFGRPNEQAKQEQGITFVRQVVAPDDGGS